MRRIGAKKGRRPGRRRQRKNASATQRLSTSPADPSIVVPIQAHHPTIVAAADLTVQAIGHAHLIAEAAVALVATILVGQDLMAEAAVAHVGQDLVAEAAVAPVGRALVTDAAVALVGRALDRRRHLVRGLVVLSEAVVILKRAPAAMIRLIFAHHPLLCQLK